jgi:hypothetical protein
MGHTVSAPIQHGKGTIRKKTYAKEVKVILLAATAYVGLNICYMFTQEKWPLSVGCLWTVIAKHKTKRPCS